jgi:hypothetical protein
MKIKKILKLSLYSIIALIVLIQFIRPEKNNSGFSEYSISKDYPVNSEIASILKTACNDCHSNTTEYPWYSNIQPVAWWLNDHVEDGKKHLNFDDFLNYPAYRQFHKLEEIDEMITEDEMPLSSYTIIHRDANLDESQKKQLIQWTKALRDSMRYRYSPEELISPKKRK